MIRNQRTNGPVNAHLISGPRISTNETRIVRGSDYSPAIVLSEGIDTNQRP